MTAPNPDLPLVPDKSKDPSTETDGGYHPDSEPVRPTGGYHPDQPIKR
jgi:hypothetical protein